MKATILSLNIAHPRPMEFDGKKIVSSMLKDPVSGPLIVSKTNIAGDSFAKPEFHGTPDSVIYALGVPQALEIMRGIGRDMYEPGSLGENLTLSDFDENQISVGDKFKIGTVIAQATFPRIPCGKVNFRLCHPDGQKSMQRSGRSGVYFRVLEPGRIAKGDTVERIEQAARTYMISDVYKKVVSNSPWQKEEAERIITNGSFPADFVKKLEAKI